MGAGSVCAPEIQREHSKNSVCLTPFKAHTLCSSDYVQEPATADLWDAPKQALPQVGHVCTPEVTHVFQRSRTCVHQRSCGPSSIAACIRSSLCSLPKVLRTHHQLQRCAVGLHPHPCASCKPWCTAACPSAAHHDCTGRCAAVLSSQHVLRRTSVYKPHD
eukprot:1147424-Pelagomonas_calceolata.AAC.3